MTATIYALLGLAIFIALPVLMAWNIRRTERRDWLAAEQEVRAMLAAPAATANNKPLADGKHADRERAAIRHSDPRGNAP